MRFISYDDREVILPSSALTLEGFRAWALSDDCPERGRFSFLDGQVVIDMSGDVIPGLYCGGESAGGFGMHGLARCTSQGFIAGRNAAAEQVRV